MNPHPNSLSGIDRQVLVDRVYDSSQEANEVRWRLILSQDDAPLGGHRFDSERLMHRVRLRPPSRGHGTVSHFTEWIYGLYGIAKRPGALTRGIAAEALIDKARIPGPRSSDWELIHCGLHLSEQTATALPRKDFLSSSLSIAGRPLKANPDYVFKRRDAEGTSTYIIVEVKYTSTPIPANLWPNVRAQLWAYGQIDDFASASEVVLVGEVWGGRRLPGLRRSVTWLRSEQQLDAESSQLFAAYRLGVEGRR